MEEPQMTPKPCGMLWAVPPPSLGPCGWFRVPPGASNPALILPSDLGGPRLALLPPPRPGGRLGRGPRLAPRLSSAGDKAGPRPPRPALCCV